MDSNEKKLASSEAENGTSLAGSIEQRKRRRDVHVNDDELNDDEPPLLSRDVVIVTNPTPPPSDDKVALMEKGTEAFSSSEDDAEVFVVSRASSGRSVWVSCVVGDVVVRAAAKAAALEILVAGRRYRVEFSLEDVNDCKTRIEADSDRDLECGACGVRFACDKHLKQHLVFHDDPPPALRRSRRIWIQFKQSARLVWVRETGVDPTVVDKWHGARASWEPTGGPLFDELNRTKVLNLRLRTEYEEDLVHRLRTHIPKTDHPRTSGREPMPPDEKVVPSNLTMSQSTQQEALLS